ncbi:MAG: DNA mismatch repair protein MutS [Thermoplasmata archaeon]|nr:DNA mismatch repair protein MutS [Thermoplasmata archaeon]
MSETSSGTPLLDQYESVKARYPGHLVLFRVGDFYETFGEDAKLLSRELDVVLTARSADAQGQRTPMAGVPQHAIETYLGRLVKKGYKVALCDQVEDARFAKGLVRREVTRVVTPGTVVEDGLLGGPDHNFLAVARAADSGPGSYALVDISTGEWHHGPADGPGIDGLATALAPFSPREILYAPAPHEGRSTDIPAVFRKEFPGARLEIAPPPMDALELPAGLRSEGEDGASADVADRILAAYVRSTQPRLLPYVAVVGGARERRRLVLDAKSLRHLEISRPMNPDDPHGATLIAAWDETVTAAGRRTLGFWLRAPLADLDAIVARQDAVEALGRRGAAIEEIRQSLTGIPDLARIASRLAGRRVRPPELAALRDGLTRAAALAGSLLAPSDPPLLEAVVRSIVPPPRLLERLRSALPDEPPATEAAGGLFRAGHSPEIDRWIATERAATDEMAALEAKEREASGIRTLKIGYNQVFGYYFEVSRSHLEKVPGHFRRRQTVAQAERFTSEALEEIERRILDARDHLRTEEAARWERFLAEIDADVPAIHRIGRGVGTLDTLLSFARVGERRRCVRPTVDLSSNLTIRGGRHPVLDRMLGERFVPNDTELDAQSARLLVLTGPNMSGKSTYMRQIGLIVVLAQAGSLVPAQFARVGLVSGLFTRMGFTDEIGRGKSSFMVEMTEVAEILRNADARSLVLLDEVGRGTSTFDGLAVAWATIRHLHDVTRCRAVLATHYHQLTQLVEGLSSARQAHLAVQERPEGIIFLHHLVPGSTDRSYGVHVARLAGLPKDVLAEAVRLLGQLEMEGVELPGRSRGTPTRQGKYTQAVLLSAEAPAAPSPIVEELASLEIDHLTPMQALAKLAELRRRARESQPSERAP